MPDRYREAIATLTEWAMNLHTGMTLRNMRAAIFRGFFARSISIAAAAKGLDVAKATAYDQKARIQKALKELDYKAQVSAESLLADLCGALDMSNDADGVKLLVMQ